MNNDYNIYLRFKHEEAAPESEPTCFQCSNTDLTQYSTHRYEGIGAISVHEDCCDYFSILQNLQDFQNIKQINIDEYCISAELLDVIGKYENLEILEFDDQYATDITDEMINKIGNMKKLTYFSIGLDDENKGRKWYIQLKETLLDCEIIIGCETPDGYIRFCEEEDGFIKYKN